jgi:hypothetical protein
MEKLPELGDSLSGSLVLCSLGGICARLRRDIARFANAPHYRLRQMIKAFLFRTAHLTKAELGFALWSLIDSDGHLAAQIIFDESSFVTGALLIPGVHAKDGEIAGLSFGVARARD